VAKDCEIEDAVFAITPQNEEGAFDALRETFGSWMKDADTIDDAFEALGYAIERDGEGRICALFKEMTRFTDDDELFDALGPWVRRGSYVTMTNSYGEGTTTYRFTGRTCVVETDDDEPLDPDDMSDEDEEGGFERDGDPDEIDWDY